MKLPYYHVDVFANEAFKGNPAGVCLLEGDWLPDDVMQAMAAEHNLSETAFVLQKGEWFGLRWFTPAVEVDLCGHATIATAHVLFNEVQYGAHEIRFDTLSGEVGVSRNSSRLVLDFPSRPPKSLEAPSNLQRVLGGVPDECLAARDYFIVYSSEEAVRSLQPDFSAMLDWECLGVIVTAPGDDAEVDFVSRFFAPRAGIDEDPATGSAHCTLIPYWANRLGKVNLRGLQISPRGGEFFCRDSGERVRIGGNARTYLRGEITLG
ncbi:MAG: PhzF family phenazine biosynthesis protein [Puniceicoccaceae bacterium]